MFRNLLRKDLAVHPVQADFLVFDCSDLTDLNVLDSMHALELLIFMLFVSFSILKIS